MEREARSDHLAQRQYEVDTANSALAERVRRLNDLLQSALADEPFPDRYSDFEIQ